MVTRTQVPSHAFDNNGYSRSKKGAGVRQRADDLRKIAATSPEAKIEDLFLALADQYEELARLLSGAHGHR